MYLLFMRVQLTLHRLHVAILNSSFLKNNRHFYSGKILQLYSKLVSFYKCFILPSSKFLQIFFRKTEFCFRNIKELNAK